MGGIVYCELPKIGSRFKQNDVLATLESVKAVAEVYCPFNEAEAVECNRAVSLGV